MGEFLSQPVSTKQSVDYNAEKFRCGACGMQGWRKRMEDTYICELNICENQGDINLFGIFDGHGGSEVSNFVKDHFKDELLKNESFKKEKYQIALEETFLKMDEIMNSEKGKAELKLKGEQSKFSDDILFEKNFGNNHNNVQLMIYKDLFEPRGLENCDLAMYIGTTACVCLICNDDVYFANVGDSRAVIYKTNKEICQITTDHKPNLLVEKQRIINAKGWITDNRVKGSLNITRSIGDLEFKMDESLTPKLQVITSFPDIFTENTNEIELIVIGCDGVWGNSSNSEIIQFLIQQFNSLKGNEDLLSKGIENLFDHRLSKDTSVNIGCDNMSCIVIEIKQLNMIKLFK